MSNLLKLYNRLKNKIQEIEKKLNTVNNISGTTALAKSVGSNECRSSPFRDVKFRLKNPPTIRCPILEKNKGCPVSFSKICNMLVTYISMNKLFLDSGIIKCDDFLKSIIGADSTTFFLIVKNLRHIID
jgi:hypothetical protein